MNAYYARTDISSAGLWAEVGSSIAHQKCLAGTLGAYVRSTITGQIGVLSNWHVLAHSLAQPGDTVVWHRPTPSTQSPERKQHIPIAQLGHGILDHDGDAAVAWLTPEPYQLPPSLRFFNGCKTAQEGDVLTKIGARSGLTRARVTSVNQFPLVMSKQVITINSLQLEPLDNQRCNQAICAAGDSGSVWFDEQTNKAVALHFAGQPNPFVGPVNAQAAAIVPILQRLQLEIL